jgi:hypothetical protein
VSAATAILVLAIASGTSWAAAIDAIAWGGAADGLRLGVGVESISRKLRVTFQNVGRTEMDVPLGGSTGVGPMYVIQFAAIDSKGAEFHVAYVGGANFVGGVLEPLLVRLAAGESYELLLPLDKFVGVLNGKDVTLGTLLRRGYAVRAALSISPESAKWSRSAAAWRGSAPIWTGSARSSEFRLRPSS